MKFHKHIKLVQGPTNTLNHLTNMALLTICSWIDHFRSFVPVCQTRLYSGSVLVNCFHHLCLFLMFYEYLEHFAQAMFPWALYLITYSQHSSFIPCKMYWALILIMYKTHLQGRNSASVMLIKWDALLGLGKETGYWTELEACS